MDFSKVRLTRIKIAKLKEDDNADDFALLRGVIFGKHGRVFKERSIQEYLAKHIRQKYGVAPSDADFSDDVHLFDYGFIDSFGAVQLVKYVEDTFGVRASPADLIAYPLNTINEIAAFIYLRKRGEL